MSHAASGTVSDSSSVSQSAPTKSDGYSAADFVCPRCKSSEKWGMGSWCPNCGYYPAVDGKCETGASWADKLPQSDSSARPANEENLLTAVSPWMWVLIGGIAGILFMSLFAKSMLHDAGLRPGFWSWSQMVLGFGIMIGAHACAARYAMRRDRRINLNDALVAWVTIWQPTVSSLPEGHRRIWSLAWGATMALAAALIIGGLDLSAIYHDVDDVQSADSADRLFGKAVGKAARVAKKNGKKASSLEEALKNIADDTEVKACLGAVEELVGGQEAFCDIFGFIPGRNGTPAGVLLCTCHSEKRKYVARISAADLTPEAINLIIMKLVGQQAEEPACPCDVTAIWVRPVTRCRVRYVSTASDGMFDSPQIVTIIRNSVGGPNDSSNETGETDATNQP